jgi:hypothetical protein
VDVRGLAEGEGEQVANAGAADQETDEMLAWDAGDVMGCDALVELVDGGVEVVRLGLEVLQGDAAGHDTRHDADGVQVHLSHDHVSVADVKWGREGQVWVDEHVGHVCQAPSAQGHGRRHTCLEDLVQHVLFCLLGRHVHQNDRAAPRDAHVRCTSREQLG